MDYLEYKGYKGTVEYCKEDECLVGKVIGMHHDLIAYEDRLVPLLLTKLIADPNRHLAVVFRVP